MWFRASQIGDSDRFRMSSIKNRIRRRKSTSKSLSTDSSIDVVDNASNSDSNSSKDVPLPPPPPPSPPAKSSKSKTKDENFGVHPPPVLRSPSGRRMSVIANKYDKDKEREKEKVLLLDRKFKNNRVMKSSSKGKVIDVAVDKQKPNASGAVRKLSVTNVDSKTKSARPNTNLNLNALLRYKSFISNTTKKLTHEDFDRLRRKSITDPGKLSRHFSGSDNEQKSISGDNNNGLELRNKNRDDNGNVLDRRRLDSDEEVFHSCNEDEQNQIHSRKSSPSLTARVAARFSEGMAKSGKKSKSNKKHSGPSAFYSQLSIGKSMI